MKRLSTACTILMVMFFVTGLYSCDKIDDIANITFNMSNADAGFDIPPILVAGSADLGSQSVNLNLDSMIKTQSGALSSDNIKRVKLTSCELILSDSDVNNNFSALQSCNLQLASDVKPEFITIASIDNNPDQPAYRLNLPVDADLDLKQYFTSGRTFTYKISATARKTTNRTLHCTAHLQYAITIGPS